VAVFRDRIKVKSRGFCSIHDITSEVSGILQKSNLKQGICTVAVAGSTAAVSTIEYEPGLIEDIPRLLQKIIPSDVPYDHDKTWGDGNGFAHLRSFMIKTSLTVPFDNGRMDLGTWQQIVFVDFDNRSRSRELIVQIIGE
jgi:secondary thiamine-phosphate synthase enzyme